MSEWMCVSVVAATLLKEFLLSSHIMGKMWFLEILAALQ
jgi:hypothetical protein